MSPKIDMKIWVLRHGEAQAQAATDAERELTHHGRMQVQAQARRWGAHMAPTHIWVSPFVRAQQTAAVWSDALITLPDVTPATVDWLMPEAAVSQVVDQLSLCDEGSEILLVSHQPLVSELVAYFTGEAAWACSMGTAYLAELTLPLAARGLADHHAIHAPNLSEL